MTSGPTELDDFVALYRTNLNILGLPTDDNIQEMATLSRFIYGLSSAYLMTGDIRFYMAAKAGVEFQRDAFRSLSADGRFCFWAFGRRRGKYGTKLIIPSENPDDLGTHPALRADLRPGRAGPVLPDLGRLGGAPRHPPDRRVVQPVLPRQPQDGSYFSHIDYATLQPPQPDPRRRIDPGRTGTRSATTCPPT